ncbi:MAG: hypothetical protein IT565_09455, partial [Rhodospirillales bacterium]|nr:hypothetical protein [Rhodospirillales bacterium]
MTAVATVFNCFGIFFLGYQVFLGKKMANSTAIQSQADLMIFAIKEIDDLKIYRDILRNAPNDIEKWTADHEVAADLMGRKLNNLSYLATGGLLDKKHFMDNYGGVFVLSWYKIEPFIRKYRRLRGEPETIKKDSTGGALQRKWLEIFSKECEDYLMRQYPGLVEE